MDTQLQGVVDYIKQCLSQGLSEADIKAQLISAGWAEDLVGRGFDLYHNPSSPSASPEAPVEPAQVPVNPHPLSSTPIKQRGLKRFLTKKVLQIGGGILALLVLGTIVITLISKPAQKTKTQNTAKANDASAIWGAAIKFAGSHKGIWPQSVAVGSTAKTLDICGSDCTAANKETVSLRDVEAADVSFKGYASDLKVPDIKTIYIVADASCKPDKSGISSSTKGGKFSLITVLYAVKSGGGIKQQCVS